MLMGARPVQPTPSIRGPGGVFLGGQKIKVIFGCLFEASPSGAEGFGHVFFGPASSAQLGLRFLKASCLKSSLMTFLEFLAPPGPKKAKMGTSSAQLGPRFQLN